MDVHEDCYVEAYADDVQNGDPQCTGAHLSYLDPCI